MFTADCSAPHFLCIRRFCPEFVAIFPSAERFRILHVFWFQRCVQAILFFCLRLEKLGNDSENLNFELHKLTISVVDPRSTSDRLYRVQHLLHQLRWLMEHDFVVEFRHESFFSVNNGRRLADCSVRVINHWCIWRWWLEQLQNVVESDRSGKTNLSIEKKQLFLDLLINRRVMEINLDDHLKFAPTCLADLVRWLRDYSVRTFVALMKLEMDFFHICLHVFVKIRFDVNSPGNSNSPGKLKENS